MNNYNKVIKRLLIENQPNAVDVGNTSLIDLATITPQDTEKVKLLPYILAKAYNQPGSAAIINNILKRLSAVGITVDKQEIVFAAQKMGIKVDEQYLRRINPYNSWVNDMMNKKELFDTTKDYKQQVKDFYKKGKDWYKKDGKKIIDKAKEEGKKIVDRTSSKQNEDMISFFKGLSKTNTPAVMGSKYNLVGPIGATTPPKY